MEDIYKRIKRIRRERNLTQQELAELAGYRSKASIAHIEAGDYDLSISALTRLCKALNVSPYYAVTGDNLAALSKKQKEVLKAYDGADGRTRKAIDTLLNLE